MEILNSMRNECKRLRLVYENYKNHLSIGKIGGIKLIVIWIIWLAAFLMFGPKLLGLLIENTPNFVALLLRTDIDNYWVFKVVVVAFAALYFIARFIGKNSSVSFLFLLLLPIYLYVRFWSTNTIEVYPVDRSFKFIDSYFAFFLPQVLTWFYYSVVTKWRYTVSSVKEKWKWYREISIDKSEPYHYLDYDLPSGIDVLDRDLLVDSFVGLLKAINAEERSVAIGVQGEWGHGKSSFILQVLNHLRKDSVFYKDVVIIEFNPWLYGSGNLIYSFLKQFSEALPVVHRNIESDIKQYAKSLAIVEENFFSTSLTKELSGEVATADELYETLSNQVAKTGVKFIVVIDDLDRLYKKEILEVLRMIRQVAAFKNLIYIVAYDKKHVLRSINSELGYGDNGNDNLGCFTDKIFQHEITLPTIPDEVLIRVFKLSLDSIVVELKERNINLDYSKFELISDFRYVPLVFKNIREIKRFLNSFISRAVIKDLGSGIDLYQFFLLEVLYFFEKEHYQVVYERRKDILKRYTEENNKEMSITDSESNYIDKLAHEVVVYDTGKFKFKEIAFEICRYGLRYKPINSFFTSVNNKAYFFLDTRSTGISEILERIIGFKPMGFEPDDSFLEFLLRDNLEERAYDIYFEWESSSTRADFELARGIDFLFHCILYRNYRLKSSSGGYVALYSEQKNKVLASLLIKIVEKIGKQRFCELALDNELVFAVLLLNNGGKEIGEIVTELVKHSNKWKVSGKGSVIARKELFSQGFYYFIWPENEKVDTKVIVESYYNCFLANPGNRTSGFPQYMKNTMPSHYAGLFSKNKNKSIQNVYNELIVLGVIPIPRAYTSNQSIKVNDQYSNEFYDLSKEGIKVRIHVKDEFWRFGFHVAKSENELNFLSDNNERVRRNVYLYHIGRAGIQPPNYKILDKSILFVQKYSNNYIADSKQQESWRIAPSTPESILVELKLEKGVLRLLIDEVVIVEEQIESGYRFVRMAAWADYHPYYIHVEFWKSINDSDIEKFLDLVGVER